MYKLSGKERIAVASFTQGMSMVQAMKEAGYSANSANWFFNQEHIQEEVEKRRKNVMKRAELTEDWIVERLMLIAGANPGELIEVDEDGNRNVNWKKLNHQLRFLINDFEEETYLEGRGPGAREVKRIKIKNADRLRAVDMLCKILGLYQEKVSVSMEENLIERLQAGRKRLGIEEATDEN